MFRHRDASKGRFRTKEYKTNTLPNEDYIHYTEYTQKNGAVSKVNKKFTSHLTWAQRTDL